MLAMQDKSGLIQEQSVTSPDIRSTISQRDEVNLLPTTQIIAPNIELLPSQMTKSQATMVNEAATCSTTSVDSINSTTNTNVNSMSTPSNDQNQVSSRQSSQHTNSHQTGTNNSPTSMPTTATTTTTTTTTTSTNTSSSVRATKRTANDYRFGKTIGEGSFSSVYIAQDIHTKKEVASKLIGLVFHYLFVVGFHNIT